MAPPARPGRRSGIGADQDRIAAAALRKTAGAASSACSREHGRRAHLLRQRHPARIQIHAKDLAAGCPHDPDAQQPQQAQADDRDALAELGAGLTKTVQGNGAQRGKGGCLEIDPIRDRRQQVAGHAGVFGVHGIAAPGAGHALPDLETLQSLPSFTIVPAEE